MRELDRYDVEYMIRDARSEIRDEISREIAEARRELREEIAALRRDAGEWRDSLQRVIDSRTKHLA